MKGKFGIIALIFLLVLGLSIVSMSAWDDEGAWGQFKEYLLRFTANIIPRVDSTYDVGSATYAVRTVYTDGIVGDTGIWTDNIQADNYGSDGSVDDTELLFIDTLVNTGTNGQMLLGQTSAIPSWQTMDTDATIDETGTVTIQSGVVTATKMAAAGKTFTATYTLSDISTEDTAYVMLPKCTVVKVWTVLSGVIAGADAYVQLANTTTDLTNGLITIGQSGSNAGDVDSCTPSANNTFNGSSEYLRIWSHGTSTNAVEVVITIVATMTD